MQQRWPDGLALRFAPVELAFTHDFIAYFSCISEGMPEEVRKQLQFDVAKFNAHAAYFPNLRSVRPVCRCNREHWTRIPRAARVSRHR